MQVKTWKCDGCGVAKEQANHWYTLDTTSKTMVIAKWDEQLAESVEFHLCGVGCLSRKLSEVLNMAEETVCSFR